MVRSKYFKENKGVHDKIILTYQLLCNEHTCSYINVTLAAFANLKESKLSNNWVVYPITASTFIFKL